MMSMSSPDNKKTGSIPVTLYGMMLALALVLSYLETMIPVPFAVPGVKWGLPNLVTVLLLYTRGPVPALSINLMRILVSGFLFGGLSAILFSLSGALLSFAGMLLLKQLPCFSAAGVSCAGGILHNIGQTACAAWIVKTYSVWYFVPPLLIAGAITGFLLGIISLRLLPLMKRFLH